MLLLLLCDELETGFPKKNSLYSGMQEIGIAMHLSNHTY